MPKRKFSLLIVLIAIFVLLQACSDDHNHIILYDQFFYGMTKDEVRALAQVSDCEDNIAFLCRHNTVPFFRTTWYQRFLFRRGRLYGVQLVHTDPKKVSPLVDSWLDSGYRYLPVAVTSAGQELDLFAEVKTAGKEAARAALQQFSRHTAQDRSSVFLYLDLDQREHILDHLTSFKQILATCPRDLVGIEETITDKFLILNFIAPIAEWQDRGYPKP